MTISKIIPRLQNEIKHNGCNFFINPYSYLKLRKNREAIASCDHFYVDGISLCVILRLFGIKTKRISFDFTSQADSIITEIQHSQQTVAIIGTSQENLESFLQFALVRWPSLNIVFYRHGYFSSSEVRDAVIHEICEYKPDYIISGMGTPLQENFLVDLKINGWSGSYFTCGGFLHQTSQKGKYYYPPLFDKLQTRWLYRIIDEPKLIFRYACIYPTAFVIILSDLIKWTIMKRTEH